jgi:hypothetical protein
MLLRQRVISRKNIGMAMEWAGSEDQEVAQLACIVADIGRVHPSRKRRLPFLRNRHPELWARMVVAGVVHELVVEHSLEYDTEFVEFEHDGTYTPRTNAAEAKDYDDGDEIPF